MKALFVTGAGTGVGKTLVTTLLIRALVAAGRPVRAAKPVISGFDEADAAASDSALLLAALEIPLTSEAISAVSPWRFRAPLSPDMAAAREGKHIDFKALLAYSAGLLHGDEDMTLIEGVGGVMVPLTEKETVLDWIAALGIPALLVTGSYLGALSHALTAAQALASRNVPLAAVVVSESQGGAVPLEETRATLARFLPETPVGALPRLADDTVAADACARLGRKLGLL